MSNIPMDADVLMLGVDPNFYDRFQRSIKDGLHGMHMGWNYTSNPAKSFEYAVEFLAKRPVLDVVFITNDIGRSDSDLRYGVSRLAVALSTHPSKPWVVLSEKLEYLRPAFLIEGVNIDWTNILVALCERHRAKQKATYAAERAA